MFMKLKDTVGTPDPRVCVQWLRFAPPYTCPKMFLSILTPFTLKSRSNPRKLLHPCQLHQRCNLVTAGQLVAENADISIFYDALKPIKVGKGDLVFGLQGLFTSRPMSLCARFEVSVQRHLMSQTDRRFLYRVYAYKRRQKKQEDR